MVGRRDDAEGESTADAATTETAPATAAAGTNHATEQGVSRGCCQPIASLHQ